MLFGVTGVRIFESDDGGVTWPFEFNVTPIAQGRIPFVVTNQRSNVGGNNVFDLWYGDVSLFRAGCTHEQMVCADAFRIFDQAQAAGGI